MGLGLRGPRSQFVKRCQVYSGDTFYAAHNSPDRGCASGPLSFFDLVTMAGSHQIMKCIFAEMPIMHVIADAVIVIMGIGSAGIIKSEENAVSYKEHNSDELACKFQRCPRYEDDSVLGIVMI